MLLPDNKIFAAVDIGSNSIHLIIARVVKGALQPLQRYRERVQLAAGLNEDRHLDDEAIQRGIACLEKIGRLLIDHQPDHVRAVATFTLRYAKNRNVFLAAGEKVLGYPINVISGREEARLIFQGVAHSESITKNTLVIDIGGGSTELAVGKGFEPHFNESCKMGCVSYSNQFFKEGISKNSFDAAHKAALQAMEEYLPRMNRLKWLNVYATSGTGKALEKICASNTSDFTDIDCKTLEIIKKKIIAEKNLDWLDKLDIGADRVEIIPGGLAILLAVMRVLGIKQLSYKDVALREGVLYEMDEQMRHPDIRMRTRKSIQALYQVDIAHAQRVSDTLAELVSDMQSQSFYKIKETYIELLLEAAQLHEVGMQVSANGLQRHSSYILENSDLPGYNQEEQLLLSTFVRCHRKRLRIEELPELRTIKPVEFLHLLALLRLALILNTTRQSIDLKKIAVRQSKLKICCEVNRSLLDENPLLESYLEREKGYLLEAGIALDIQ